MPVTGLNNTLDLSAELLLLAQKRAGALADLHASATAVSDEARRESSNQNFLRKEQGQRQDNNLTSLARLQPVLSPSDELALFAEVAIGGHRLSKFPIKNPPSLVETTLDSLTALRQLQARDALQKTQEAQLEKAAAAQPQLDAPTALSGAQAFAAYLYARNNDIVFNTAPLSSLAA